MTDGHSSNMKADTMCDISSLILRAFSLAKQSTSMAFVGIYSAETYEPLALADREHVQINAAMVAEEHETKKMAVEINPSQIHAIVRHIRTPDNPITQINIAKLQFLCLSHVSGSMTGISNFNTDTKRVSVADINESVFRIIHKKYTSQDLLQEEHALHISAIIRGELILVGLCREGEESSLEILKTIFEKPNTHDTNNFETHFAETESTEMKSFSSSAEPGSYENGYYAQEPILKPEVELRHSAQPQEERRRYQQKREKSVCEDDSTGAVKMSVPFRLDDDFSFRDDRALIANIEPTDMCPDENVSVGSKK